MFFPQFFMYSLSEERDQCIDSFCGEPENVSALKVGKWSMIFGVKIDGGFFSFCVLLNKVLSYQFFHSTVYQYLVIIMF